MVPGGGDALLAEEVTDLLYPGPGGAVDDAALLPPGLHQGEEEGLLLLWPADVEEEVGPVKPCDHLHRILEAQLGEDVLLDLRRGGGGEGGDHRPLGQAGQEVPDLQIAGAEVLPPLGDAVGLIHRHLGDGLLPHHGGKTLAEQPLRGHVEKLIRPPVDLPAHPPEGLPVQGAVEEGRRDARLLQGGHLVLHQGDQGGDHQGEPRQQQGRDLIAQGLPPAGGHHPQSIPPGQDALDEFLLPRPEGGVTVVLFENPLDGFLCHGASPLLFRFYRYPITHHGKTQCGAPSGRRSMSLPPLCQGTAGAVPPAGPAG